MTKPFRRARLWLGLWWLALAATVVACLLPAADLPPTPEGADKLQHLAAFALLAAGAVQLYAGRRTLAASASGLVLLGIAIELAQGAFTATRTMDAWDGVADAVGVLLGMATAWTPWRDALLRFDARGGPSPR